MTSTTFPVHPGPDPDFDRMSAEEIRSFITATDEKLCFGRDHGAEELFIIGLGHQRNRAAAELRRRNGKPPTGSHRFSLVSVKDIMSTEDAETHCVLEGILPSGGMSLIVAKPKVGKTTLALNLAIAVARGAEFLGRKTVQSPVVYLALEEKTGEVKRKLKAAGVVDEPIHFHFGSAPLEAIKQVESLILETGAKLLVIDVLQKFCRVKDLNDYAQVTNTLEPLLAAARKKDCHIALCHHAGKADRQDGDDILGSTGLLGGVDTSIHIKKRDRRRTFFTIQRYGEDVPETVIELRGDGSLEATGSREAVEIQETQPLVVGALSNGGAMTIVELYEAVERSKSIVSKVVNRLLETNQISRAGSGKKGDPYKYSSLPPSITYGGGKEESKTAANRAESKQECLPRNLGTFSLPEGGFGEEFLEWEGLKK